MRLMQQAQEMQGRLQEMEENLQHQTVTGTAGGGMVTVEADGKGTVRKVKIDPSVVDPNDVGMLEDLVTAAINAAATKIRETSKEKMAQVMGPMAGLPGIPGF